MKKENTFRVIFWMILLSAMFIINKSSYATHAQGADITYQCLGGNQYQINVSFYRDCSGVNAPNSIVINTSSVQCGQSFNTTLNQIAGTGNDITPICNTATTVCNGGSTPGVEEYIYRGIVTLPTLCNDWTFSFTLCCRNNAINTINNPGGENIYVEAVLNNLDFACNNSPTFSNPPVSFPCVGQTSCFNHGVIEPDGDSLYYSLVAPATGPATAVTYIAGYSPQQPLNSNPATTFNSATGDICMTPTLQEVTVLAVKVEEFRNEILVGSVLRDIQLRTINCTNNLPTVSGINGTGQFTISACANSTINFSIPSNDIDAGQTVSLNWNNAIPAASFTDNGAQLPIGNFNWTPTANDISNIPYCFTLTVSDDNCPLFGTQIYSFCITVGGFTTSVTATNANCGASNGTATVSAQNGIGPYTYQWSPNGGNNANANGLQAGQYTVIVTDATGCTSTSTVTVGNNGQPGNININTTDVSCFGNNDGSATANVNGGQPPYTYLWSNGSTNQTTTNLAPGLYYVQVTTNNGCIKTDSIFIFEPTQLSVNLSTVNNTSCFNGNDGDATATASGGVAPYNYLWNSTPTQNTTTATGLSSGVYTVIITDNNGCTVTQDAIINEPQPLIINLSNQDNVSCYSLSDGSISVNSSGGVGPYSYNWNNNTFPNNSTINNLNTGTYILIVTDANGCSATTQINITEPQQLITSISNTTDISCFGLNDGSIQTTTVGGTNPYSYSWNLNGGILPSANNLNSGNYIITTTDFNGCTTTATTTINEPTPITTLVQGSSTICPGQPATLNASASGGTGSLIYQWSNGFTGATQMVSPPSATTYSAFAVDANGCTGTIDSAIVLVNDISLITLSTVPDTALCEGSTYLISANIIGGIGSYTYSWNNGLGNSNGPFPVAPLLNTNYTVTVTDNCGNSVNQTIMVDVNPLPTVNISPQTKTECGEATITLANNNTNQQGSTYEWDFGDNTYSNNENPEKSYSTTGVYNVMLIVTSPFGCQSSATTNMNITVNPNSVAQFEYSPEEITMLDPTVYFENLSFDADFYNWTFGDGTSSTITAPTHEYQNKGTYIITLKTNNQFGCKDEISKEITIDPEYHFYIPNAFTPNGNGRNEIFTAVGEEIEEFDMQIFNRWGELIYESTSIEEGWNGTAKGGSSISQEGVYVYNIKLKDWKGLTHRFTGHVTLIK
jgi:gliding motility-associated-like protein